MEMFDDSFYTVLHSPVPNHDVVLSNLQLGYSGAHPAQATALLEYQHASMQHMKKPSPTSQSLTTVLEQQCCTTCTIYKLLRGAWLIYQKRCAALPSRQDHPSKRGSQGLQAREALQI